jgi:hypothetical protein
MDVKAELYECLQNMWDEGQGDIGETGNYHRLKSDTYNYASCGFAWTESGGVLMNQDLTESIAEEYANSKCSCDGAKVGDFNNCADGFGAGACVAATQHPEQHLQSSEHGHYHSAVTVLHAPPAIVLHGRNPGAPDMNESVNSGRNHFSALQKTRSTASANSREHWHAYSSGDSGDEQEIGALEVDRNTKVNALYFVWGALVSVVTMFPLALHVLRKSGRKFSHPAW